MLEKSDAKILIVLSQVDGFLNTARACRPAPHPMGRPG